MVCGLNNIEFYLGAVPVKNPEEAELSDTPYQKDDARKLDVIIDNNVNGYKKSRIFYVKTSFSYCMPEYKNGILDYEMGVIGDSRIYNSDETFFFGKIKGHDENDEKMNPAMLIRAPRKRAVRHYEFYSLDNNKNVHKTSIDFKFSSLKNSVKFRVDYDNKIRVKIDTDGYYIMSGVSANGNLLYKKGNLINEEDSTLYLDKDMPIKISIKQHKQVNPLRLYSF